ncbi:Dynein heavy chain 8 [Blattella germanica]|nr:Dynein heavy chain 8 [Blattella germanica]
MQFNVPPKDATTKGGPPGQFATTKKRKMSTVLLMQQQSYPKEARATRSAAIMSQHRHVLDTASFYFDLDYKDVEEGVIDADIHIKLLDSLFSVGGRQAIMIVYGEMDLPPVESGRLNLTIPQDSKIMRVIITNGIDEIHFSSFTLNPEESNTVEVVYGMLAEVTEPVILKTKIWGDLLKTPKGISIKEDFLTHFESFVSFLHEIIQSVEAVVRTWAKQIEQVLTQSQHLRRERDDIGPLVELQHWRRLLAKFTSIVEHLKSQKCKHFIQFLTQCRSKLLKKWKILDNRITDATNEAADNIKYLYSLEKYCMPLYDSEPNNMVEHIPKLMFAIRMIYATSRHYNTTGRVTALLVKITNQMITSCRIYLTSNFTVRVWDQPKHQIIKKMEECLHLYSKYFICFQATKNKIKETPGETSLECSEMYVFGKFETFKERLEKIIDVLETVLLYSILQSSRIEGIDVYANKFTAMFTTISTKEYQALDHRKPEFDSDYLIFKNNVSETENELREFMNQCLTQVPNIYEALRLLQRFDKLNLNCLIIEEKYLESLSLFQVEVEELRDHYNEFRNNPQLPRNMPPISGRIMWIRQFYKRINEPIEMFKMKLEVECPKKSVAKKYNIPKSTLQFRLGAKFSKYLMGPAPDEETLLVMWIVACARKGFPQRKLDIQLSVKVFLTTNQRKTPFKENTPGDGVITCRRCKALFEEKESKKKEKVKKELKEKHLKADIITSPKARKVIRLYNALATVFVHYELIYHRAWHEQVKEVRRSLAVPLLAKNPKTNRLIVNFDDYITEAIRETEYMWKLGLETPDVAQIVAFSKKKIFSVFESVKGLVETNDNLRTTIPKLFIPMMKILLSQLDHIFQPGLSTITWTSLEIPEFCEKLEDMMTHVQDFIKEICFCCKMNLSFLPLKLSDIKDARVDQVLESINNTITISIPKVEADTPVDFLEKNLIYRDTIGRELELKSSAAERAVIEIINKFLKTKPGLSFEEQTGWLEPEKATKPIGSQTKFSAITSDAAFEEIDKYFDLQAAYNDCNEIFAYFNAKILEALVRATKLSLEVVKRKVGSSKVAAYHSISELPEVPLLKTEMILMIPQIVIQPSLEDIQANFIKTMTNMIEAHKLVIYWGQRPVVPVQKNFDDEDGKTDAEDLSNMKSYYKSVSEHKEVMRSLMSLQGAIGLLKPDIAKIQDTYLTYAYLWPEDREEQIKALVNREPLIQEIEEEFTLYEKYSEEINRKMKLGLLVESNAWKISLGRELCAAYKLKLNEMVNFIKDKSKQLERKLKDLDDVRLAMNCLGEIRENFIQIDMDLGLIEETYATFARFNVDVAKEDAERVDTLRYTFQNMIQSSKVKQEEVCDIQEPLKLELLEGVSTFRQEVINFDHDFDLNGPMVPGIPAREASDRVLLFQARFDDLWHRFEMYSSGERLFGMEVNDYPLLHKRKKELNLLNKLYGLYNSVMHSIDGYFDILWTEVDIESIKAELQDFQLRCRKLPKGMKDWPAFIDLKQKIDDFNETCPLLELMANKAMKDRHWKRLSKLTGYQFDVDSETFTLRNVMEAPLLKNKDEVEDICISAVKEKDIEAKLKQVIADWSSVELQFSAFKTRGELLLKGAETMEVVSQLEDSLMVLGSLLSNRYNAPFKKDIQTWVHNLSNTSEILENWMQVQNLWIYLEAVFVGGDIAKQLPAEAKRFSNIDKTWVKIMGRAHEIVNVIECCVGDETMGQLLPHLLEQLESCQKSLTGYLESKRLIFPRFFFISDPSLLEILGQASDSHSIQNHLLGLFDNVARAGFHEKEYDKIISVYSRENECIMLEKSVMCIGGVEFWLGNLLQSQKESLGSVIANVAQSLNESEFDLLDMEYKQPAQVGLLLIQLVWTRDAEIALKSARTDKTIMKSTSADFLDILNLLIEQTVKELSKFDRTKFETLVTMHLHQYDIFEDLYKLKIKNPNDFEWLKQSRFYYDDETDDIIVKITDVDFIYQNEFLGCQERLVITPLTDRCYITLAQAIGMSMGGAPAGPAGTGKTETTKDMGRALGKYVVVFNCSDQMDFRGLGRIFKGLAQSGSWGCFDEFNRIELPVLSVAAQQIAIVLSAKKERKAIFIFSDGDTVSMNNEFGIFLTMNPGYAGRQELPENLKINFRTVAMMVPDRQIIIRVKLASCGFKSNIPLARKFFTLYKLCEEQLSKQVHYDFGLRNILSVLRTLGAQKRAHPNDTEDTTVMRVLREMNLSKLVDEDEPLFISLKRAHPNDTEDTTVMRVLREMNLSKLVDEDEPLFISLVDDLFPGLKLTVSSHKELQKAIALATKEAGLINHPDWNLKIVQFYETSLVRHGLMALGPTGSGKTTMIHTLMRAMTEMGLPHKEMRMNPKAITAPQMFGRLDVATNDWTDGIFSTLWRRTLRVKKTEFTWLVLDGPVDAVWIENLNSVLDDNKTLTLANGDRITMADNSKLLFEPDNVDNASPATVSRMGMVFISASALKWPPILEGWLLKRSQQESEVLRPLFDKIYEDVHQYLQARLHAKMTLLECMYIRQCTDILQGLLDTEDEQKVYSEKHLERLFLFSVMWSIGAVLELEDRAKVEEFVLAHNSKLDWPRIQEGETIFEYAVNEDGLWQHWSERVEQFIYPTDSVPEYASILVPNVDNVRTAFLISNIAKQFKAVLLIGEQEQGTAKTVMIKGFMSRYDIDFHLSKSFNFSSASTPNMFQRIIESYVDKRVGTTYGPPAGKKMTVFIDDINMPVINEWGDQVTNEIVRQLMEMGGFYSLDKPGDFSIILDIQLIAAMIHPGGGRNDIPPRLKRQFCIFNCTLPSNNSMDKIFSVIGEGYFCEERFKMEIVKFLPKLIPLTRIMWQQTKVKMLPTPAKFHYIFNLRDLSRIWEGILYIQDPEMPNVTTLLKLWHHECTRIISDRFICEADREWFDTNLRKCAKNILESDYDKYFPKEVTYFVDFLREPPEATGEEEEDFSLEPPKIYEEMPSYEFVKSKLFAYTKSFVEQIHGVTMDMVFFHDAMVHLMIISRIIRLPRGNALLVGVGGSGKQSLTRLASFMAGYRFFQITLTRSYNAGNLMDDLKYLYRVSGFEGKGISFIFTDNEIKEENFLEFINNVLSAGEVANLFARDELDEITSELIPVMKKNQPRRAPTPDNLYDYFISRARANLHVVLCFSPVGEKFRSRAMKFPGLISGCTIDWFFRWPRDALVAVSHHFLDNFKIVCTPEIKTAIIEFMGDVHDHVAEICLQYYDRFRRQTHVTPKSFLSFLDGYKNIYGDRLKNIGLMAKDMTLGLSKLVEAAASVDELRKELQVMEAEIAVATAKAEEVLAVVTKSAQASEKVKAEVEIVKDRAQNLVDTIAVDKALADKKLEAALPALEAAEAALLTIKAADISTVRKLGKPPYLITLIMDAVLILFQRRLDPVKVDLEKSFIAASWAESLKTMADTKFLTNLLNFPKDKINGETVDLLSPYLDYSQYTYENAKAVSGSVAGLAQWTIAMRSFYSVNKEVLPLKANLAVQQAKLNSATTQLKEAEALLEEKENELRMVQAEFDQAMSEKQVRNCLYPLHFYYVINCMLIKKKKKNIMWILQDL